ncbi:MAG: hypothetical protein ACLFVJ_05710 [Persicimonas sp.]
MRILATKSRYRSLICLLGLGLLLSASACASSSDKTDEPAAEAQTEPTELSAPPYVGRLESAPITGMGFQQAVLTIEVASDFSATGSFEGGYDGRNFDIPLDGSVDRQDGSIELSGRVAAHDITVAGELSARGFQGAITGDVSADDVNLPVAAEPAEADTSEGPLSVGRVVDLILQVLDGLGEAHEQDFVHRDLKPINLLITRDCRGGELVKIRTRRPPTCPTQRSSHLLLL